MWAALLTGLQLLAADPADEAITQPPAYYDPVEIQEATRRTLEGLEVLDRRSPGLDPYCALGGYSSNPVVASKRPEWPDVPVQNSARCDVLLDVTPEGRAANIRVTCVPIAHTDGMEIPVEQAEGWEADEAAFVRSMTTALLEWRYERNCVDGIASWRYDRREMGAIFTLED